MNNFPPRLRHDSGRWMELDEMRLMLSFKKPFDSEAIPLILKKSGLVLEDIESKKRSAAARRSAQEVNHTAQRLWTRSPNGQQIDQEQFEKIEKQLQDQLDLIEPVYRLLDSETRFGLLCPLTNVLVIKPALTGDEADKSLARLTDGLGLSEDPATSRHLGRYRYYVVREPRKVNAYRLRELLLEKERGLVEEALLQNMPLLSPFAAAPNDPNFADQWNMAQIGAPAAWDMCPGPLFPLTPSVLIAIFDSGCQLDHPDLLSNKFSDGTTFDNLGGISGIATPRTYPANAGLIGHGTWVVGVANAAYNNNVGVAGLAGGCLFLPIAFNLASDVEVAAGIGYAVTQAAGAGKKLVINMSFGNGYDRSHIPLDPGSGTDPTGNTWHTGFIDGAIAAAQGSGAVMCAATHNHNTLNGITYPATNPKVIACGASDLTGVRYVYDATPNPPIFPNGQGSNYGAQMSVVAPGASLPTTGLTVDGGLKPDFHHTSAATPHVAGLAALLFAAYPTLGNKDIRNLIERTVEKTGVVAYTNNLAYPNGTWNEELGYGRIHAYHALNLGDVMIRDYQVDAASGLPDAGAEPSTPLNGDFWDFSDIVVRTFDDNVFNPGDPAQSNRVERNNDNFVYIQVFNKGPATARNVVVDASITPFVGTQFAYSDWTTSDATHIHPAAISANLGNIASGGHAIAKFSISAAQTNDLWGWENLHPWHPCLLAKVTADNDYAFQNAVLAGDPLAMRLNNLAQRNLTVVNLIAPFIRIIHFPFVSGHRRNLQRVMEILVDRTGLPREVRLRLLIDDDGAAFPLVDFHPGAGEGGERCDEDLVFLERTRIETSLGCCRGILTLEKGSRFHCLRDNRIGDVSADGGKVVVEGGKRYVDITQPLVVVTMEKQPGGIYPFSLQLTLPPGLKKGDALSLRVSQRDESHQVVGGAGVVYVVS